MSYFRRINWKGRNFLFSLLFFVFVCLSVAPHSHAATLYFLSSKDAVTIGDTFDVSIKTDSEGVGINAVQATIQFPKDILTVTKTDKADSIFNFWLEEPSISNDNGKVAFVGGSTTGAAGKSLQILKITFSVKGSGRAQLAFTDGTITASDGSGTNVLSKMDGFVINSIPKTGSTGGQVAPAPTEIPKPVQITRPATPSAQLPVKPEINISLYPDQKKWYSGVENFLAQWQLPSDVSGVSTLLDQNIGYRGETSEGLFDSKVFPAITKDGDWYLHVRFKNNLGWGPVTNHHIGIDTQPPLSFAASVLEGNPTDEPAPTFNFTTKDALSGIREYQVFVGGGEGVKIPAKDFIGSYKLPLQPPGKRPVIVRAIDEADNYMEDKVNLEILPIASPVITFSPKVLFSSDAGGINARGTSLPKTKMLLKLAEKTSGVIASAEITVNDQGAWDYTFDQSFHNGTYVIHAQSQDSRGALSLVVDSRDILVKSQPIIQFGSFHLGATGALVFLLLIIAAGFVGGFLFYKKRQEKIVLRVTLAENDLVKVFNLISDDLEKLKAAKESSSTANFDFAFKKLQENVKKMEGYLKRGVEKIRG